MESPAEALSQWVNIYELPLVATYLSMVDHGLVGPSTMGTVSQYLKSVAFLPILLPILNWRADLATGALVSEVSWFLVLLNSAVWALGAADDFDYMHARYYNPQVGRFLSTDPVLGESRRPQSWNRFSYALNNPQKWLDPKGEVVSLASLTEDQRDQVLRGLNEFTGNTYALDDCYNLVLVEIGAEASPTATQFLNSLIDSPITFEVQAGKEMRWNQPSIVAA